MADTVKNYVRKGEDLAADYKTTVEVEKIWKKVIQPAMNEISRKASSNGWEIDSHDNDRGFNQINRFNRSCSIRTKGTGEQIRKLTIGWRAGSDSFSFGNTLATTGWKNVKHSSLSLPGLVEDLSTRLLV